MPRPSAASPRNTRAKPVRRDAVPQHEARVRNGRARPRPDGGTGTAAHATRPGAPGPEASPGRCVLSVSVNTGNRWRGRDLLCATLNHRAGIKRSGRRRDRRTPGRQVPTSKGQQAPGLATRVNRALGPAASSREMRGRARLHLACVVAARCMTRRPGEAGSGLCAATLRAAFKRSRQRPLRDEPQTDARRRAPQRVGRPFSDGEACAGRARWGGGREGGRGGGQAAGESHFLAGGHEGRSAVCTSFPQLFPGGDVGTGARAHGLLLAAGSSCALTHSTLPVPREGPGAQRGRLNSARRALGPAGPRAKSQSMTLPPPGSAGTDLQARVTAWGRALSRGGSRCTLVTQQARRAADGVLTGRAP